MNAPVDPATLAKVSSTTSTRSSSGRVFLTGTQALIRLLMLQRERDQRAGLNTAGFISGYRGSPLGGLDQALWRAQKHLERAPHQVPARRERGPRRHRRSGARSRSTCSPARSTTACSACGTARARAWTAAATCSSTPTPPAPRSTAACWCSPATTTPRSPRRSPHQSEHILKACCIPVLNPANVQDYLDFGLHGFAMSRYSGCWIAFKCVTDVVESGASVDRRSGPRAESKLPDGFRAAAGRPQHPLARRHPRAGSAPARLEGLRRARLRARQRPRPHRLGFAQRAPGHRHHRQVASATPCRRSPTWASTRTSRATSACASTRSRMTWPLEPQGARRFAAGPGRNPGGRGKAPADRVPDQGRALQLESRQARAARGRQVRRQRRVEPQPRASPPAPGCCPRTTSTRRRWSRARSRSGWRSWA